MKKFKKSMITLAICAVATTGYNAYERATMTEEERLFQANLEALTDIKVVNGMLVGYIMQN